ncbi:cupin domain-containing protein [Pseudochryseolinea flava]|uniref:DUF985 domain-containing protein n=1 Tax=Pseudochryseolinea flava TaxID=2059302 RepID=A0A364Y0X9_9BACT|nr:cupin domain-containing protein [Pseudochryseolinea flava]RAV99922.1 hypothetical protein DQQ10_16825 [Pseudochryseolinea flava]
MRTSNHWIEKLHLLPHPEGGFYRETYRADGKISHDALSPNFKGDRNYSTAIFFLLRAEDRSVFHRIHSDEIWYYHAGGTLSIYILDHGKLIELKLGCDIDNGEHLQVVVPAGKWFGAIVKDGLFVLSSCTVAPGFDFADFEMASRLALLDQFPSHEEIIIKLTK